MTSSCYVFNSNPNEGPHDMDVEWPIYSEESRTFLEMTSEPKVKSHNEEGNYERYNFWIDKFYWTAIPTTEKDAPSIGDQIDSEYYVLDSIIHGPWYYNGVTWASWCLKSPATRLSLSFNNSFRIKTTKSTEYPHKGPEMHQAFAYETIITLEPHVSDPILHREDIKIISLNCVCILKTIIMLYWLHGLTML